MKKSILLLAVTFTLINLGFGQNILFLKSGDKMNGKLEGYRNDTIIFKLKGNKLRFKTSDILAIYFDQNLAPQDLNKTTTIGMESAQEGKIFGVVTYFFNKNFGDKPDIGAKVYIADSSVMSNFNFAVVDSFYYGNSYRNMYLSYQSNWPEVPDDIIKEVKKYKVEDKASFDALDDRAMTNILKIEYAKNVKETFVDGSGNYSVKVKPGTYYVYIKSNNRKGSSMTEVSGKIKCKKIIVKKGEDSNMSCNFDLK